MGWAISARDGTASGAHDSGSQSRERRKAFAQWKNTCSTATSQMICGRWPLTTISSA